MSNKIKVKVKTTKKETPSDIKTENPYEINKFFNEKINNSKEDFKSNFINNSMDLKNIEYANAYPISNDNIITENLNTSKDSFEEKCNSIIIDNIDNNKYYLYDKEAIFNIVSKHKDKLKNLNEIPINVFEFLINNFNFNYNNINDFTNLICNACFLDIIIYYDYLFNVLYINPSDIKNDEKHLDLMNNILKDCLKSNDSYLLNDDETNSIKNIINESKNINDRVDSINNMDDNKVARMTLKKNTNKTNILKNYINKRKENYMESNDYEHVNNPKHYNNYDTEVIDMMLKIWGTEKTAIFCQLNAFKYRMRMGTKPDNNITQDLNKETWYLNKFHELLNNNNIS